MEIAGGGCSNPPTTHGGKRGGEGDMNEPANKKINTGVSIKDSSGGEYRIRFNSTYSAPYVVHVQKKTEHGLASLDSISFGSFIFKKKCENILKIKSVGRQKVAVEFNSIDSANAFLDDESLSKAGYISFIPKYLSSRMGVLRNIPADMTEEDLLQQISTPRSFGKIIKLRRLTFKTVEEGKNVWKPARSIVVTVEGKELPSYVYLFYNRIPVETYVLPTVQCYKCCKYGHTKLQCRGKEVCYRCSGGNHTGDKCHIEEENVTCVNCGGRHTAVSVVCPELGRQKHIKKIMAENSISYYEASLRVPRSKPTYSSITAQNINRSPMNDGPPPRSPNRSMPRVSPRGSDSTDKICPTKKIIRLPLTQENNKTKFLSKILEDLKSILIAPDGNYPQPEDGCIFKSQNLIVEAISAITNLENHLMTGNFVSSSTSDSTIISQLDNIRADRQLDNIRADRQLDNITDCSTSQKRLTFDKDSQ